EVFCAHLRLLQDHVFLANCRLQDRHGSLDQLGIIYSYGRPRRDRYGVRRPKGACDTTNKLFDSSWSRSTDFRTEASHHSEQAHLISNDIELVTALNHPKRNQKWIPNIH